MLGGEFGNAQVCLPRIGAFMKLYIFGMATTMLLTMIAKFYFGRHRPHFEDVCVPKYGLSLRDHVDSYTCRGNPTHFPNAEDRAEAILDAHCSFVLGHSAINRLIAV